MVSVPLLGWLIRRLSRSRAVWVGGSIAIAVTIFVAQVRPLGTTTVDLDRLATTREIVLWGEVLGVSLALVAVRDAAFLLTRLGRFRRFVIEYGIHATSALLCGAGGLALSAVVEGSALDVLSSDLPLDLVLSCAHVSAVAVALARLPVQHSIQTFLPALLIWLLPAFAQGFSAISNLALWLFDVGRHLSPGGEVFDRRGGISAVRSAIQPAIAWATLTLLVDPQTPSHALRNSR